MGFWVIWNGSDWKLGRRGEYSWNIRAETDEVHLFTRPKESNGWVGLDTWQHLKCNVL